MRPLIVLFACIIACFFAVSAEALDSDGDGLNNNQDNCDDHYNPAQADGDNDEVGNVCDNCSIDPNSGQVDSDDDGYGNICDADLTNDGIVGVPDFQVLVDCLNLPGQAAGNECRIADLNADHRVDDIDLRLLSERFGYPPGPSGLVP